MYINVTASSFLDLVKSYSNRIQALNLERKLLIAVRGEYSERLIAALYAISDTGHAFVVIDSRWPETMCNDVLRDLPVSYLMHPDSSLHQVSTVVFEIPLSAMYFIRTSGSTGTPKYVVAGIHSVNLILEWMVNRYNLCPDDHFLAMNALSFDLSIFDLYAPRLAASKIQCLDVFQLIRCSPSDFMSITIWNSTPTILSYFFDCFSEIVFPSVRLVLLSGESTRLSLLSRIRKYFPNAQIVNLGGATESTIWSNFYEIPAGGNEIYYGTPMPFSEYFIADENGGLVEEGEWGELFIGGSCLALGYWESNELQPFQMLLPSSSSPLFRTGDKVRHNENGLLEIAGRLNRQCKINGNRIDPSYIEAVLLKHLGLDSIAVVPVPLSSPAKLVAFYKNMSGRDAERFLTKSFEVLPSSMCPSQWVRVVDWPLSETGKLDISYLVDRYKQNESTFIEPASELESDILKAFESVAGVTPLSVVDNYFDVGGDSLSVLRLIGLLDHKGISISLADVYAYPTSRALAAFVSLTNH